MANKSTHLLDGEKAAHMRDALLLAIARLPDTAHKPRHDMREVLNAPSLALAVLFDAIQEG